MISNLHLNNLFAKLYFSSSSHKLIWLIWKFVNEKKKETIFSQSILDDWDKMTHIIGKRGFKYCIQVSFFGFTWQCTYGDNGQTMTKLPGSWWKKFIPDKYSNPFPSTIFLQTYRVNCEYFPPWYHNLCS